MLNSVKDAKVCLTLKILTLLFGQQLLGLFRPTWQYLCTEYEYVLLQVGQEKYIMAKELYKGV